MNSKKESIKRMYTLAMALFGIAVQTMFVYVVWINYYNKIIQKAFWYKGHFFIMCIYFIVLFFFTRTYGGLKIGYLKTGEVMFAQIFANICANFVFYVELCLLKYGFPSPTYLLSAMAVQILFILIQVFFVGKIYYQIFPPYQVLVVYGNDSVTDFSEKLKTREDKFKIRTMLHVSAGIKKIEAELDHHTAVILWDIPNKSRNDLFKLCYDRGIRIYVMPKISDIILTGSETMHFFDTPLLLTRSNPLSIEQSITKRLFDLVFAVLLLIPCVPLMFITAICIKLYDGGSIFYKQVRCTLNGKEFYIYKFRSMVENAEKDGVARLASKSDQRITPIGKFIRATRLDELPQLMNVLRGDMSFVGPRPERPELMDEYKENLPEFSFRLRVKAGLTGYAQIYGKYNTTPYDKLKLDLYYIEHYSIWLDIKLLILTAKIVFTPESTEGI